MIDRKKSNANPDTSARGKKGLARLPVDAIPGIESEIGERFRDWAMELVIDERWKHYREALSRSDVSGNPRGRGLLNLIGEFSYDYAKLLDKAMVEFVKELGEVLLKGDIPPKEIEWQEALDASFRFAERFTRDQYAKPWEGFFVLPPRPTDPRSRLPLTRAYLPDKHAHEDFQKMHVLAGLFAEAEALTTPEEVAQKFSQAICSDEWKSRAAHRAENQFHYAYFTPAASKSRRRNPPSVGDLTAGMIARVKRDHTQDASNIERICRLLDAKPVPVRERWKHLDFKSWHELWKSRHRPMVKTYISRIKPAAADRK